MGGSDPYHFTLVSRPPSETPDHGWVFDNLITSRCYLDHPVKPLTMGGSDPYHFTLVSRPPSETPDHGWVSDPYHFTLVSRPPSETPDHGWV